MIITLFFISLSVFILGLSAVILKYGVPESISESYYLLPKKVRLLLFYGWTVLVGFPLVVFWLDISTGTAQPLIFFGCGALIFVGVAAPFREKGMTQRVHIGSALLCALLTQLWISIYTPFWIFSLSFAVIFTALGLRIKGAKSENTWAQNSLTFFLELTAFLSAYIAAWGYYQLHA